PTKPGMKLRKFHLVPAAASTSLVSMPSSWKMAESSFMKAILRSRCAFSITFAASATLIEGARRNGQQMKPALLPCLTRLDHRYEDVVSFCKNTRSVLSNVNLSWLKEAARPAPEVGNYALGVLVR